MFLKCADGCSEHNKHWAKAGLLEPLKYAEWSHSFGPLFCKSFSLP